MDRPKGAVRLTKNFLGLSDLWLTKLQSVAGVLGPFLPIAILGMMLLAFLLMSQILSFVVARSHFVLPILYLTEGRTKVLLLLAIGVLGIFGVL